MPCQIFSFTLTLLVLYGRVKDASGCGPDPCPELTDCLYGRARDLNGCLICECYEHCYYFKCPEGSTCRVIENTATNTVSNQCVQCPAVRCTNTCPYGYINDANNCPTCDCWSTCQFFLCRAGQKCVPAECFYTKDCPDIDHDHYCIDTSTPAMVVNNLDVLPMAAIPMEESAPASLRQCCPSVGLSSNCLEVCLTNPSQLFMDNTSCLSPHKIWDFINCVSASRMRDSKSAVGRDLLGSLLRRVGPKILNFLLHRKESVREKQTAKGKGKNRQRDIGGRPGRGTSTGRRG